MKKQILLAALVIAALLSNAVSADMYSADLSNSTFNYASAEKGSKAQFIAQALQYDPYPVSPGEWFDVWVKVQNIGDLDAPAARFELMQGYPFTTSDNPTIDYGIVSGVSSAYKQRLTGETQNYANQIILKFRVKTADNSAEGTAFLKISATPDYTGAIQPTTFNLPITIAKTKTDFDVVMQDSTAQGTSFAISNIGSNTATAVTLSLKPDDISVKGAQSYILGNLNAGDFTTVTFQIMQNSLNATGNNQATFRNRSSNSTSQAMMKPINTIDVDVAYTDTAGVRNVVTKTVPVDVYSATGTGTAARKTTTTFWSAANIGPAALGLVIGLLIAFALKRKKKQA